MARDDAALAREHGRSARETFEQLGLTHDLARSRRFLGKVATAEDAPAEAREHWRTALEGFETASAAPDALVTLKEVLALSCEHDADERAREWWQRAREVAAEAPEPTAARHRDWIERHAAELELDRV